jgi:hypothetical protein
MQRGLTNVIVAMRMSRVLKIVLNRVLNIISGLRGNFENFGIVDGS